jgi:hypothetical protein
MKTTVKIFNNARASKWMTSQNFNAELIEETFVKAYVIKKCLDYRFNSWMVDGNMLFTSSDMFRESTDPSYDFYVGKGLELFYARSTSSAGKFWDDDLFSKVVGVVDSSRKGSSSSDGVSFVYIAAKLLKQKGARMKTFDDTSFGMKIGSNNVNQSSLGDGKKMVFWSTDIGLNSIQMRLQELGLWNVDSDSSCRAVVCHRL